MPDQGSGKIQTLFIDIGRVLVDFNYERALSEISNINQVSVQKLRQRLAGHPDIRRFEMGHLNSFEFFQHVAPVLEINITLEKFKKIWEQIFVFDKTSSIELLSEDLFHQLKQNFQLVSLSNTNEMHFECLIKFHPLIQKFDNHILSYEVGFLKPEPAIYHKALETVGRPASETFFIDDLVENVESARSVGIESTVFVGETELRKELSVRGILDD